MTSGAEPTPTERPFLPTEGVCCVLCGGTRFRRRYRVRGFRIVRCPCGLVLTNPRLDASDLARLYSSASYYAATRDDIGYTDYQGTAELRRRTFGRWFHLVERSVRRPGRLLDVGCATGVFLGLARDRGWEAVGQELSAYAAGVARAKGFRVVGTHLSETDWGSERFDVVTMFDVIEHLQDPQREAHVVRGLLRRGGHFAVVTPNVVSLHARLVGPHWFNLRPEEHLHYFSPPTLHRLLRRAGFRILYSRPSGEYQRLDFVARRLGAIVPSVGAALTAALSALHWSGRALYLDSSSFYVVARAV